MAHNDSFSRVLSWVCLSGNFGLHASAHRGASRCFGSSRAQVRDWCADGDLDSYYGAYNGTGYNVTYVQDDQAGYGALTCSEVHNMDLLKILYTLWCKI